MAGKKRTDSKGRVLKDNEYQRPDGQYMYRYTDAAGKKKYIYSWKLVPTDKIPAGKRDSLSLREQIKEITEDKHKGIDSAGKKKYTLNDIFDKYIAGKTELKASTRVNYLYMYDHYVRGTIGKRKIADIKYSDIKQFYNSLLKGNGDRKGFQVHSMEIIHTILHPTFTLAVRDDIILKNPTDNVMSEIKREQGWERPKRHALTLEQQHLFMDFLRNSKQYNHWYPIFAVMLGTGCRVGELVGLRWKDVDLTNGVIYINHNLTYRPQEGSGKLEMHITTPKTSNGNRTIPMISEVRHALAAIRVWQMEHGFSTVEIDGYHDFVFVNQNGNLYTDNTLNRALKRIRLACNAEEAAKAEKENRDAVKIPHFSVHNLRHTFCTRFCENETNVKVIQEIMGHADISTTMNIYAEATEEKKKATMDALDSKISLCSRKVI